MDTIKNVFDSIDSMITNHVPVDSMIFIGDNLFFAFVTDRFQNNVKTIFIEAPEKLIATGAISYCSS